EPGAVVTVLEGVGADHLAAVRAGGALEARVERERLQPAGGAHAGHLLQQRVPRAGGAGGACGGDEHERRCRDGGEAAKHGGRVAGVCVEDNPHLVAPRAEAAETSHSAPTGTTLAAETTL